MSNEKIRLNRLFNIFSPKMYKFLLVINSVLLILGIYFICVNKQSIIIYLSSVALVNIIAVVNIVLHCPKTILINKEMAEFDDYINMRPRYLHGNGFWWLKVSYSVTDIKDIQFYQNVIEKIFNAGHISFSGKAVFTCKRDIDRVKERDKFVVYGIKNFSCFKQNFYN